MNAFINYLVEANLGLCFFLLLYWILLKGETDFALKRAFVLISIAISLIFPLFHITTQTQLMPAIGSFVPRSWLQEVVVYAEENPINKAKEINFDVWQLTGVLYAAGVVTTLVIFGARLLSLFKMIRTTPSYKIDKFTVIESTREDHASFSFFRFIFIGKSDILSQQEKALIINHECIHAQRLHSFDVLITNVMGIFFWFNPAIKIYKKIFVHLHEYEADARSVKSHDVNDYCSLLAKVALLSADIRLANHFSNSLTLKRIEMMRKIRSKIKPWKIALIAGAIPLFFFAVSCQDVLVKDVTKIARNPNIVMAEPAPILVLERFEELKKKNPGTTYILVEFNEEGTKLMEKMEKSHGVPALIELFTPDNDAYEHSVMNTEPEKIVINKSKIWEASARTFGIIGYSSTQVQTDKVYTEVDVMAVPVNGMPEFYQHVAEKITYPREARSAGIEGKVYVEFIVQTDGSISDIKAVKGIGGGCDEVAVIAVKTSASKWVPAKINGISVKQAVVMPISFKLATSKELRGNDKVVRMEEPTIEGENIFEEVVVAGYIPNK